MFSETIPVQPRGYLVSPDARQSFVGPTRFCRLEGPGKLMRLVQLAQTTRTGEVLAPSRFTGEFWFDESLFQRLRSMARADLAGNASGDLVGLHMRFTARDALAVSRNWNEFDATISITIGPGESIVALEGRTREQPYFSQGHADHAQAKSAGISLPGGEKQYVVDFNYPANLRFATRIVGPVRL